MSQVTADDVLKSVADIKTVMSENHKSMGEKMAQTEALARQAQEDLAVFRREFVKPVVPLAEDQGRAATQRGGMFEGRFMLPYKRMVNLPASNPAVLPRDAERLRTVQDLHDACVIQYWTIAYKLGTRAGEDQIRAELEKTVDYQLWRLQVADLYSRAANDILNPAGGEGVDLDFTLLSAQLIELVRIEAVVATQFRRFPLTRAHQAFPALRADMRGSLGGLVLPATNSANVGAMPPAAFLKQQAFGKVQFDAVHNVGYIPWTDDMIEDSVVPLLPVIREGGAIMLARSRDSAVINGDTTATHFDSDVTAAEDFRKAWDGLRRMGANNEATINAAITSADFFTLMRKLGKFGRNPRELVMFLNVMDWLTLCADPDLKSVDKVGIDRATLREGVTDRVAGIDIVVTEEVRRDLNVGGVFDNVTTNNTIEILCNRNGFWHAVKGETKLEEVRVPQALGNYLLVDMREDFQAVDKESTDQSFAAGPAPVAIAVDVTANP